MPVVTLFTDGACSKISKNLGDFYSLYQGHLFPHRAHKDDPGDEVALSLCQPTQICNDPLKLQASQGLFAQRIPMSVPVNFINTGTITPDKNPTFG